MSRVDGKTSSLYLSNRDGEWRVQYVILNEIERSFRSTNYLFYLCVWIRCHQTKVPSQIQSY